MHTFENNKDYDIFYLVFFKIPPYLKNGIPNINAGKDVSPWA